MKCKRVKDLIVDYIDGEISQTLHKDITTHLETCPSCRELEQSLRRLAIEPLRQAEKAGVPERIWLKIKQAIVNKKQRLLIPDFINQLRYYFRIRRPVLVPVVSILVVILMISVLALRKNITTYNMLNAYLGEQAEFILQLAENGEESYFGIDEIDLGTSIEQFLL
jgi:predicted anti-sigma-YlaC factor YlaD